MEDKIVDLKVVYFADLDHAHTFTEEGLGFNDFAYGDAEYTLVTPGVLIDELEGWEHTYDFSLLTAELRKIPPTVLVALEG